MNEMYQDIHLCSKSIFFTFSNSLIKIVYNTSFTFSFPVQSLECIRMYIYIATSKYKYIQCKILNYNITIIYTYNYNMYNNFRIE